MHTKTNLTKALVPLALLLSASMVTTAQAVTINTTETGTPRSLDGVWAMPSCDPNEPADPGETDQLEVFIFEGNTLEVREIWYASRDGSCSGHGATRSRIDATVSVEFERPTPGWLDNEIPTRLDGGGPLATMPDISFINYQLENGIEEDTYYMDDTAEPWCIYREDDGFLSAEEPLCKLDIIVDPLPRCEVVLDKESYLPGEFVTANLLRLSNTDSKDVEVELKIWFDSAEAPSLSVVNTGAFGNYVLAAGAVLDLGPVQVAQVVDSSTKGAHEFSCRLLDPTSGEILFNDRNLFNIE